MRLKLNPSRASIIQKRQEPSGSFLSNRRFLFVAVAYSLTTTIFFFFYWDVGVAPVHKDEYDRPASILLEKEKPSSKQLASNKIRPSSWWRDQANISNATHPSTSVLPLDLPSCPQRTVVPQFTNTSGGVVIFFHIPKNGGSSITLEFNHLAKTRPDEYNLLKVDERFEESNATLQRLTNYLENPTKTIQLVEFHGMHPVFSNLKVYLETMREKARKNGVPFFVFCVTREPLGAFLSTFNFFCFQLQKYTKCEAKPTSDHAMKLVKPNPQSRWLCKTSETFESNFTIPSGPILWGGEGYFPLHCPGLLSELAGGMDWIGQLDDMGETIRLLREDLGIPMNLEKKNPTNKRFIQLDRSNLTESEVETIKRGLQLDYEIYNFSKRCFRSMKP